MKVRRIATLVTVLTMLLVTVGQARPPTGAIFTTTPDGGIVNENVHYELKREVYLDGGPPPNAPQTAAGLDDGYYVFQVTDPSGHYLLSMDPARCRVVRVEEGVIQQLVPPDSVPGLGATTNNWADKGPYKDEVCHILDGDPFDRVYGPSGRHDWNYDLDYGPPAIVVQLMPFGTTPNPGGVYKAWIIPLGSYTAKGNLDAVPSGINGKKAQPCPDFCAAPDPGFGPPRSDSKTDNFKVKEFYPPEVTVRKFHDLNCDGAWDGGEPEIGVDQFVLADGSIDPAGGGWPYDWTYPLDGSTNTEPFFTPKTHVASIPGTYSALEGMLNGWGQCAAFRDGVPLGVVNPVAVDVAGFSHETHEIVFGDCQLARVSGRKVIDLKAEGSIDGDTCDPADTVNYPGCAGVTVHLDGTDNLGNTHALTTQTDAGGYYEFAGLYPGHYTITIDDPSGFECSYPEYGDCSYEVDLLCSDDLGDFDFGDFSRADVYGRKVIDITGDGPSDDDTCPLEPDPWGNNHGCQGVLVDLDGNRHIDWQHVHLQTYTDQNGYFEFLDLYPGDYTIAIEEPHGFFCSYPDPCYYALNLSSDEVLDDLLFGDYSKAEVHGRKVIDIYADGPTADDTCPLDPDDWGNNAGCQGVTVNLEGWDSLNRWVELSTQTDDNGYFEFLDLYPGDYSITVDEPGGFFCSYPDPCYFDVSLMSDQIADELVFGDYSKAEIHAFKCFDSDESGTCDEGESPVADIEFCLYDAAGALVSCKDTGSDGFVHWLDLKPGTYTIEETLPPGWFCTGDAGQTATLISDEIWEPDFGNVTNCVGLTPGYWVNWRNHYTDAEFEILLEGTIAADIDQADEYLASYGCDGDDAFLCMRRFLLANQLTLNLTHHPELPNPDDAVLWYVCEVPGYPGNLGYWLGEALAIYDAGGVGYTRDYILHVKTMLDKFANLDMRFFP